MIPAKTRFVIPTKRDLFLLMSHLSPLAKDLRRELSA